MNIQLTANIDVDGDIVPVSKDKAEFFSLYVGVPGEYDWLADISNYPTARMMGRMIGELHGYRYIEDMVGGAA